MVSVNGKELDRLSNGLNCTDFVLRTKKRGLNEKKISRGKVTYLGK